MFLCFSVQFLMESFFIFLSCFSFFFSVIFLGWVFCAFDDFFFLLEWVGCGVGVWSHYCL